LFPEKENLLEISCDKVRRKQYYFKFFGKTVIDLQDTANNDIPFRKVKTENKINKN
jgi:hypothetical protein